LDWITGPAFGDTRVSDRLRIANGEAYRSLRQSFGGSTHAVLRVRLENSASHPTSRYNEVLSEAAPDDFSDMEAVIRCSAAATSLEALRPQFPAWRKRMVVNGFPHVPPPLSSAGVHEDAATNLFLLLVKQASDPTLRKQRANAADEHNLRNMLGYMGVPMLRERGRWKP
jgi:hypothetical protein